MHELSIALGIVDGALEELRRRSASEATAIYLRVGRLAAVDNDALLFSYNIACQDTPLAGSRLLIENVEVVVFCPTCGAERATRAFPALTCAECGAVCEHVIAGDELEIRAMEVVT